MRNIKMGKKEYSRKYRVEHRKNKSFEINHIDGEEWKLVRGYNKYFISNKGRVLCIAFNNTDRKKILNNQTTLDGYKFVQLSKNGKVTNAKIHRLVAQAFIPNPNGYPQVNHKDEDKSNNCVENLEWCSAKYNNTYGTRCKRAWDTRGRKPIVCTYNDGTEKIYQTQKEAEIDGFSQSKISLCLQGKRFKHGGCTWRFL